MKVRFAISPGRTPFGAEAFAGFVDGLEERRFDTVWLADFPLHGTVEPLLGLSIAGGRTKRLKLGANLVLIGRNPTQLAKYLAQLDHASAGRLLLMMVPGQATEAERRALGAVGLNLGDETERIIAELRALWATDAARPLQDPLEVWLGGRGPKALERAGRVSDGWLGAATPPGETAGAVATIRASAEAAGREVDPEHFGMSIACAREAPSDAVYELLRRRRPDLDPRDLVPVGADGLRRMIEAYVAAGCSKFVVSTLEMGAPDASVDAELDWLAEVLLPLQT